VKHDRLAKHIGTRDIVDNHPLIVCAPHVLAGHAHIKGTQVTLERVLAALQNERKHGPLTLPNGLTITDEQVRACFAYSIDIFDNISKLYAELGRLRGVVAPRKRPATPEKAT
jgi:uncharacterized protein (DUF433 family)